MHVTLKYNKNTREITLVDGDECCEHHFTLLEDNDDELSVIVMQDYDPEMLEGPVMFKAILPEDELIDTE